MLKTHEHTETLWWNRTVKYWQENQSAITFHSPLDPSAGPQRIIESLHLDRLNQFLNTNGFNLKSFRPKDVPGASEPPPPPPEQERGPFKAIVEEGVKLAEEAIQAIEGAIESVGG